MSNDSPILNTEQNAGLNKQSGEPSPVLTAKRQFVEPEVTFPVDVLEATSFFIVADSAGSEVPSD